MIRSRIRVYKNRTDRGWWLVQPPHQSYVTHHASWADAMRQANELCQYPAGILPARLLFGFSEATWAKVQGGFR